MLIDDALPLKSGDYHTVQMIIRDDYRFFFDDRNRSFASIFREIEQRESLNLRLYGGADRTVPVLIGAGYIVLGVWLCRCSCGMSRKRHFWALDLDNADNQLNLPVNYPHLDAWLKTLERHGCTVDYLTAESSEMSMGNSATYSVHIKKNH